MTTATTKANLAAASIAVRSLEKAVRMAGWLGDDAALETARAELDIARGVAYEAWLAHIEAVAAA